MTCTCKCRECGSIFSARRDAFYCSPACRKRHWEKAAYARAVKSTIAERQKREDEKVLMRFRLRERDAAYAEKFPTLAQGERRGRIPCAHVVNRSFLLPIV